MVSGAGRLIVAVIAAATWGAMMVGSLSPRQVQAMDCSGPSPATSIVSVLFTAAGRRGLGWGGLGRPSVILIRVVPAGA